MIEGYLEDENVRWGLAKLDSDGRPFRINKAYKVRFFRKPVSPEDTNQRGGVEFIVVDSDVSPCLVRCEKDNLQTVLNFIRTLEGK